jgi:hypothetical protein
VQSFPGRGQLCRDFIVVTGEANHPPRGVIRETSPPMIARALLSAARLAAFATIYLHADCLRAQSPVTAKWRETLPEIELPLPTPTPPTSIDLRPSATFTFADATQIKTQSTAGRFRLVGLHLSEAVDIALEFPAVLLSSSVTAQSLDGGTIISFSKSPGGAGSLASMRFRAGARPGLYRVLVPGLGGYALLQFWVADPNNPKVKPPVLNPGH